VRGDLVLAEGTVSQGENAQGSTDAKRHHIYMKAAHERRAAI
jgi:hypothetical protein